MKTSNEWVRDIREKADRRIAEQKRRRSLIVSVSSVTVCAALLIGGVFTVPYLMSNDSPVPTPGLNQSLDNSPNTTVPVTPITDNTDDRTTQAPPDTVAPPADTSGDGEETLPPAVGGSVCGVHNPAYHWSPFFGLELYKGFSSEEINDYHQESGKYKGPDENGCLYPMANIREEIKHFNLTREEVEDCLNTTYYDQDYYFDVDALFEEDYDKIRDWAEMSFKESTEKADSENKGVIRGMKLDLAETAILNKEQRAQLFHISENFDPNGDYTKEYQKKLKDETLDKDEVERDYLMRKYRRNGKYTEGDSYTVAYLIKTLSVPREEAEKIFEKRFEEGQKVGNNMPKATWRIDFDKLYGNLDYYADLLGKDGFKYAYLVDEEYIIK